MPAFTGHTTGHADLPHPALGQNFTPSPTTRRAQAGLGVRAEVPVEMREWIGPALASPDLVLDAQPPAQPHSGVTVDRPIRYVNSANTEVVGPSAQRTVQLTHQLCGFLPGTRSVGQDMDLLDHAPDAFL